MKAKGCWFPESMWVGVRSKHWTWINPGSLMSANKNKNETPCAAGSMAAWKQWDRSRPHWRNATLDFPRKNCLLPRAISEPAWASRMPWMSPKKAERWPRLLWYASSNSSKHVWWHNDSLLRQTQDRAVLQNLHARASCWGLPLWSPDFWWISLRSKLVAAQRGTAPRKQLLPMMKTRKHKEKKLSQQNLQSWELSTPSKETESSQTLLWCKAPHSWTKTFAQLKVTCGKGIALSLLPSHGRRRASEFNLVKSFISNAKGGNHDCSWDSLLKWRHAIAMSRQLMLLCLIVRTQKQWSKMNPPPLSCESARCWCLRGQCKSVRQAEGSKLCTEGPHLHEGTILNPRAAWHFCISPKAPGQANFCAPHTWGECPLIFASLCLCGWTTIQCTKHQSTKNLMTQAKIIGHGMWFSHTHENNHHCHCLPCTCPAAPAQWDPMDGMMSQLLLNTSAEKISFLCVHCKCLLPGKLQQSVPACLASKREPKFSLQWQPEWAMMSQIAHKKHSKNMS